MNCPKCGAPATTTDAQGKSFMTDGSNPAFKARVSSCTKCTWGEIKFDLPIPFTPASIETEKL